MPSRRIFTGVADRYDTGTLYSAIITKARSMQ
jgi:hypothetical protein